MQVMKYIRSLCTPAFVYFVLSAISYFFMVMQNVGNTKKFCLGGKSCEVPSTIGLFVIQALYIGFWVFALNFLCEKGYKSVSWFILLLPLIIGALALVILLFAGKKVDVHVYDQVQEILGHESH